MKTHFERLCKLAHKLTPPILQHQIMDEQSPNYGDIILTPKGYSEPGALAVPVTHYIGMYYNEQSVYYHQDDLLQRSILMMDIILDHMHEDGTMDLRETNFHDATMIGFLIIPFAYDYRVLVKNAQGSDLEKALMDRFMTFFHRGADGMLNGGFHTPNHRWVMASAFALLRNILDDARWEVEARKFLREGIDCDDEGEYTERSVAIYDITSNESMIILARELNMPELLDHVARNLTKNIAYMEPDGTICTLNSRRQDNSTQYYPLRHYWSYVYMAHYYDARFAGMAEHLLGLMETHAHRLPEYLFTGGKEDIHNPMIQYMLDEHLLEDVPLQDVVWNREWYFEQNGVMRCRHEQTSLTLIRDREVFFKYQTGDNIVTLRIGTCFFGKGYFTPQKLEQIEGGYRLRSKLRQGYYKTLDNPPASSVWEDLPKERREKVHIQEQDIVVDVYCQDHEVKVVTQVDGVPGVPLKLELMLLPLGRLETTDMMMMGIQGTSAILKNGSARYTCGFDTVEIDGGAYAHWNTDNMRGTKPMSKDHFTLYMTGFTPFNHTMTLSRKASSYDL